MAKAAPETPDKFVVEALEKALLKGKEARLITSGKKPEGAGLFSDEKGARKKAVEKCLNDDPPLLKIVRSEEVQVGKRTQNHRFVTITLAGIDFLCSKLPPEKSGELFAQSSLQITGELRNQQNQIDKIIQARQQLMENVEAMTLQLLQAASRIQAATHDAAEKSTLLKTRLSSMPLPASVLTSAPDRPPLRRPATEEEAQFRQRLAQEMVFAWQEAAAGCRPPIERALFNTGAEPLGQTGEQTGFDGRIHECSTPVFPGDSVEIVRSGWMLRDELGGYLLAHAQVRVIQ